MTAPSAAFRGTHFGLERLASRTAIPRHRHRHGYIALVLGGGYHEAGLFGRFDLQAGDVAVHRAFDAHLDQVGQRGAEVLNLPLPPDAKLPSVFSIGDPDGVARLAERDPLGAALSLVPMGGPAQAGDWPDELATTGTAPTGHLGDWAQARGLAAESVSRGFRKAYGVTPARFRIEMRAGRALHLIMTSEAALAAIAADCGFADQPHMTRIVTRLTGHPPGYWRRSISFKTGAASRR